MEPRPQPAAHQHRRRYCLSRREMMRRASLRQTLQQPASSNQARAMPLDQAVQALLNIEPWPSTRTWPPTAEVPDFMDEDNQDEAQEVFIDQFNNLAVENRVPLLAHGDTILINLETPEPKQPGLLRRIFSGPSRPDPASRQSVSDLAYHRRYKPDVYTSVDLEDLQRLSSKSLLRLPPAYAPYPLAIPTCLRACAQFIAEKANTRGIFRVSGSERVVEEFSRYYNSVPAHEEAVLGTVLQDTLPVHIAHTIHDVASTFKRFLARLPGGILASPKLFNVFVAIHEQLDGPSELSSGYRAQVRARLIALAIQSIRSKSIRHVICAVFGLLHMIGRITELLPEERVNGQSLHPDHQFVDYEGLGVCVGPLLSNDPPLKPVQPTPEPRRFPWASKLLRRQAQELTEDAKAEEEARIIAAMVKRAMDAASVAEMLITHWRDVVYELKVLNRNVRDGVAMLHLEYREMPPLSSDPDIGNPVVDSDVHFEAGSEAGSEAGPEAGSVDSQETVFLTTAAANGQREARSGLKTASAEAGSEAGSVGSQEAMFLTTAAANGQRDARSGLKTASDPPQLTPSNAIRRPTGTTKESARMILLETEIQQLKEFDMAALHQQLQDANGKLSKWKERALAAEKKARLFQKFTMRVRHLYGSPSNKGSCQSGDDGSAVREESDAQGSYLVHSVRLHKALEAIEKGVQATGYQESIGLGDGDAIAAKIFQSLYPRMQTRDGPPCGGSPSGGSKATATGDALLLQSMDGVASPRDDEETLKLRLAMVELWMAVQELLRMEDEEASSTTSSSSTSSSSSQQSSTFTKNEPSSFL
ncbi:uncharacterized protein TrAtP1_011865 [Trichoderma atroviride]|nr:hypothetical protein TrAtP1_011865 [Trichoderma atroviride]